MNLSRCCIWQRSIPVSAEKENALILERGLRCRPELQPFYSDFDPRFLSLLGMAKFRHDNCGNFSWALAYMGCKGCCLLVKQFLDAVTASPATDERALGVCRDTSGAASVVWQRSQTPSSVLGVPLPVCLSLLLPKATFSCRISGSFWRDSGVLLSILI